ncbi:alpha/beta fold hydrolase [Hydrogenophaga laconesensis]|uniref:Pimeloyl-ACP methyl ester carboxylesterase n=1 Tax=Hydrogenophaga laconesensis TaxID=1805971 RepID=A0ABU1VFV6_9BURK|nr:alpha/beta hydrolase [Hydrogenophaga laconesensis]MDR7096355.1 pimeloyl-ACP methyl ester carboxylesterase [Hydrogenophaga laconesensis]
MRHQFSPHLESPHAVSGAMPVDAPRRMGRFAETRGTPALRRAYAWLCHWSPTVAARLAYRQLATPPRAPLGKWPLAVREQVRTRREPCGAGELVVHEWGWGPAVLLVHGWGGNATHMGRMVAPLLAQGFRVIAFDGPAHGRSSGSTTDMVAFAGAVAAVARRTGPLHAVIGHSFGAAMALFAARDWGIDARRMVLVSVFNHCNWFVEMFAQHAGLTPEVQQRVRDLFVQRYSGRFDWHRMSVLEMARQAQCPALLVHDENDQEIPFAHGLAIAAALPAAQFKATLGLGHHCVVRNPEVIRRVVAFLSEQE